MLLLYYFFIWGFIKVKNQFKGNRIGFKSVTRVLFSKVAHFIGLKTISPKDSLYFLLSMIIGMVFNFLVLIALLHFDHGTLLYVSSPSLYVLVQNLILPPILEELIFRGIYLSVFLKVLGKNYVSAVSGLVLSAFTFGWCPPTQAIVKTIAGFLLGFIYLFAWKKNIAASSLAHFGANLVGTFFIWVS
jgi:membrane protease YdiL (CAAX protease family)